jgi:dTDP-4-dehydrorhamnose 3,5-epimerase
MVLTDAIVTSDAALFAYKCTARYNAKAEASVLWSDPEIGIRWPTDTPVLSEKDRAAPPLGEVPAERLPRYEG